MAQALARRQDLVVFYTSYVLADLIGLYIPRNSTLKAPRDVIGLFPKKFVVGTVPGSTAHFHTIALFELFGVDTKRHIEVKPFFSPIAMEDAFQNGDVDAVYWGGSSFLGFADRNQARLLLTSEHVGNMASVVTLLCVARRDFIRNKRRRNSAFDGLDGERVGRCVGFHNQKEDCPLGTVFC